MPAWKRWAPILLRPEGLYGTRPAEGGNKAAKLRAIREALRTARRVWLATDCDREGQLIGQEILEHYEYRDQVMRVLFTAQDARTIRDAFGRAKPNSEYARLYAAAVARRQADQIYNLSLTRTATVILGQGARRVIGVGRVKTPTLAIVCKRELEIRHFVPLAYFEVVATAKIAGGQFQMRHAPQDRIVRREIAQEIADAERFADSLVRQKGIKPPPGYKTSISICRKFLNEHAPKKAEGETPGKLDFKPVSTAQMLYAKKVAQGKGVAIPEDAKANSAAMSAWINSNRSAKRRRRGRKTAYKPAGSVAPRSIATTKRSRKRKPDASAAPPASAQPNSVTGTPLRIPYGNKEVALKLGAHYRSGGWYAPPGVDLSAFGERGWL